MMTFKDNLQKIICHAMVYKKMILWMDLDIQSDDYIRNIVVEKLNNQILEDKSKKNYVPTKLVFEDLSISDEGIYNQNMEKQKINMEDTAIGNLHIVSEVFTELENIV